MQKPATPSNERARIKELQSFNILDTLPEEEYDNITKIASEIAQTPIGLVSLIDTDRQWFKSHHGLDATQTPRDLAFCAHAINDQDNLLEISDARKDDRFFDNPLVTDAPNVIFYAGMPLVTDSGNALGTLCVIDHQPKKLTSKQKEAIQALAKQVVHLLELRKTKADLEESQSNLLDQVRTLEEFANITALDMKSPLANIVMIADVIQEDYEGDIPEEAIELTKNIQLCAHHTCDYIDSIAHYSKVYDLVLEDPRQYDMQSLIEGAWSETDHHGEGVLECTNCNTDVSINYGAVWAIFKELFSNAINFAQSPCTVRVSMQSTEEAYEFTVTDNGPGMTKEEIDTAFDLFSKFVYEDRYGVPTTGIGLAVVKKLVEGLDGSVAIDSSPEGTTVTFRIAR